MRIGGQILWIAKPICETFKISYLMGRPRMRDVLGSHLKDRLFHLVHWLSITLSLQRTSQESINLERKSYLDCSLDTLSTRVEFGRVTYWSQTLRSWKRWTHRKSTQKRLNAKQVIFPKENGKFIFPIADGRIKTPGGDQELRTSTLIRPRPIQGESHVDFLGVSERSFPPPHDSFPDAGEAINDFWSMSGNFIYRHHVEPRVKLGSPREESFPIPLKYIDVTRTTHTNLDVKQEKRIDDYWNIDGSRDLSDPWTGFTQFTILDEKAPDGYTWSRGRLTRKQLTSRPDHLWPELWKSMGKHAKLKKSKSGLMKSSILKTHEDCEEFLSSTPRIRNSRKPSRTHVRSWKHQWLLLCLVKLRKIVGVVDSTKLKNKTCVYSGS